LIVSGTHPCGGYVPDACDSNTWYTFAAPFMEI
jgi:hypothetical protein